MWSDCLKSRTLSKRVRTANKQLQNCLSNLSGPASTTSTINSGPRNMQNKLVLTNLMKANSCYQLRILRTLSSITPLFTLRKGLRTHMLKSAMLLTKKTIASISLLMILIFLANLQPSNRVQLLLKRLLALHLLMPRLKLLSTQVRWEMTRTFRLSLLIP